MESYFLEFECVGLKDGDTFPIEYTGYGDNISPEFIIKNLSPEAKTIAIVLEDIRHELLKTLTHWIIWNIPANERIQSAIPPGKIINSLGSAKQGIGYGWHKYSGPKPPKGKQHEYKFTLYTLDCELDLSPNSTQKTFLRKAGDHIIQKGTITGKFSYNSKQSLDSKVN